MGFIMGILKYWKWIVASALLSAAIYFGYDVWADYRDTKAALEIVIDERARLETVNAANEAALKAIQEANEKIRQAQRQLQDGLARADARGRELELLLSRHDLEFLALSKPGLIERRINDATDRAFADLECITGGVCPE